MKKGPNIIRAIELPPWIPRHNAFASSRSRSLTKPAPVAVVGSRSGSSSRHHKGSSASGRRSGIVIGRTAKALF